jgi:hypothetical protein
MMWWFDLFVVATRKINDNHVAGTIIVKNATSTRKAQPPSQLSRMVPFDITGIINNKGRIDAERIS